jgi:DNA polymerase III epsilon subunit family exonuclease
VQLAFDSLDRLVELVEERGGRVVANEAARALFAAGHLPQGAARSLLGPLVEQDARLTWRGSFVALVENEDAALEDATFVVFDLETTGLQTVSARICEIGAVRVQGLEVGETFETLVSPGVPLPAPVGRLTGLTDAQLRRAPRVASALRRFSAFAGDAVLVAHNARFDVGFVNAELERMTGKRVSATVIDTVSLARNVLRGRVERTSLASLSFFFGVSVEPCHRALPDAQATAEVFVRLLGLAQERGVTTVSGLEELAAPRPRRVHGKRRLAHGAPERPGVYLFHDRHDRVLYVGKARDLRARLRSYFQSHRQRSSVEVALDAVERIEWRVLGSELAAALEEVRLIRELRPPANARKPTPERYVYLRRRGEEVVVTRLPSVYGPLRRKAHADRAARALGACSEEEFDDLLAGAPLVRLYERLADLADCLRYEDAARLRDRIASLERVIDQLCRLDRLRRLEKCLLAPALEPGACDAFFVAGGRVLHRRGLTRDQVGPALADAGRARDEGPACEPEHADELLVVGSFLRRPPPELRVLPLDRDAILARLDSPHAAAA